MKSGRPYKYVQLRDLAVGESALLEWEFRYGNVSNAAALRVAVIRESHKGKKFLTEGKPRGLLVTRVG